MVEKQIADTVVTRFKVIDEESLPRNIICVETLKAGARKGKEKEKFGAREESQELSFSLPCVAIHALYKRFARATDFHNTCHGG